MRKIDVHRFTEVFFSSVSSKSHKEYKDIASLINVDQSNFCRYRKGITVPGLGIFINFFVCMIHYIGYSEVSKSFCDSLAKSYYYEDAQLPLR